MHATTTSQTGAAAAWVSEQASRYGMTCENGEPITRQQVKNWWGQVQRRTPKGATATYDRLKEIHKKSLDPPRTDEKRQECGRLAVAVIMCRTKPVFCTESDRSAKNKSRLFLKKSITGAKLSEQSRLGLPRSKRGKLPMTETSIVARRVNAVTETIGTLRRRENETIGTLRRREKHHPGRHHLDRRAAELAAESAEADEPDQLLTTSDVAEWLGISTQWLEIGRGKNYGPKFVVLSTRRVRYRRADVLAWLAERTHANTAEYRNAK
jgi:predicted DNA-binding transcriptional regulator AlpA